jgi:hypothetical protein
VLEGVGWSEDEFTARYDASEQTEKNRYCFGFTLPNAQVVALDTQGGAGGYINDFRRCIAW